MASDAADTMYPYPYGDVWFLGPQCFVTADRKVISWQGINYYAQPPAPATIPWKHPGLRLLIACIAFVVLVLAVVLAIIV